MSKDIDVIVDDFIEAIKDSTSYKEYIRAQEMVKDLPDVIAKINEIRALNLQLQSIQNSDQAYDVQEKLEKRFDELSEDQRVYDFIEAENSFIGLYQEINRRIMDQIQVI
ncbi:MAG: YlbF family regulator [Lachnospiraceae bacterium]|nr:YlbF family regulator [Lachnospiraceae bacterium]